MIEFSAAILNGPALFRTSLARSGELSPEEGGMPLHEAIGVNNKRGSTTENQCAGAWHVG